MEDGSVALAAGGELSADNRAVNRSIVGVRDNFACAGKSNSKSRRHDGLLVTACVGAFNSVNGKLLWYAIMFSLIKPNQNTRGACILPGQHLSQNNAQALVC